MSNNFPKSGIELVAVGAEQYATLLNAATKSTTSFETAVDGRLHPIRIQPLPTRR